MDNTMAEDYQRRTERIKNLLSSYYGTGGEGGGDQPGTPTRGDQDGPNLGKASMSSGLSAMDSPAFNAERHIAHTLKAYPLDRLMTEHRSMSREIKNLDSDMQQLVYENYNKFIAATDTIRTMKTNVDGMGTDMEKLKSIIDNVSDRSNSVNLKLQRRRDHIEELHKVQALLKKLQAVFDLPKKMRAALEEDALDSAVTFYSEALPLLRKHGHRSTFRAACAEAEAAAREISQVLKRRLTERKEDTEQVVVLLRKLGEPDDTLQDKYLQGRAHRMRRMLKEAGVVVEAMGLVNSGAHVSDALLKRLESPSAWGFSGSTPPALKVFVRCVDERLINAVHDTVASFTDIFLAPDINNAAKRKPLLAVSKDMLQEYFRLMKRALADAYCSAVRSASRVSESLAEDDVSASSPSLKFGTDWGADTIAQSLQLMSTDLGLLSGAVPELCLRERAAEVAEAAVRHHVAAAFTAMEWRVAAALDRTRAALGDGRSSAGGAQLGADGVPTAPLRNAFAHTQEMITKGLAAVMQGLKAYESHARLLSPWHDAFVDTVQAQLQHLLLQLLATFTDMTGIKYEGSDAVRDALRAAAATAGARDPAFSPSNLALTITPLRFGPPEGGATPPGATDVGAADAKVAPPQQELAKPGLVLLLCRLCIFMEGVTVPWVMETLALMFQGRGGGRGSDQPPAFVAGEVARRLGTAANALLSAYVELHGRQLSLTVRRSVAATNWLAHKEPRAPRPVCELLMERLAKAQAEVSQVVESSGQRSGSAGNLLKVTPEHSRVGSMGASGSEWDTALALESGAVERNVARLFRDKPKVFGAVKFTQAHVMSAIMGVGLKSLVECVRLHTLGRAGLQQLQLDMHYLRPLLRRISGVSCAPMVDALLDEVVAAALERSTDPSLLEPAVLDRILSAE